MRIQPKIRIGKRVYTLFQSTTTRADAKIYVSNLRKHGIRYRILYKMSRFNIYVHRPTPRKSHAKPVNQLVVRVRGRVYVGVYRGTKLNAQKFAGHLRTTGRLAIVRKSGREYDVYTHKKT